MKTMEVVCGAIYQDGKYLIAKRGKGIHEDIWEFPGGKVEPNETQQEAIIRELKEELDVDVQVIQYISSVEDHFDDTVLHVHAYLCELVCGTPSLHVHKEMAWVSSDELLQYGFQPADHALIADIQNLKKGL